MGTLKSVLLTGRLDYRLAPVPREVSTRARNREGTPGTALLVFIALSGGKLLSVVSVFIAAWLLRGLVGLPAHGTRHPAAVGEPGPVPRRGFAWAEDRRVEA
jgi:hypothetical protein